MARVVITEKPSVARDLGRVLGVTGKAEGYLDSPDLRIGWCFGHMAELQDPAHYDAAWRAWDPANLPMLPTDMAIKVRDGAKEQVQILTRLLKSKDTTEIINACDAGREGELIFRYVLELAGVHKPVRRLWVSSMTDEAIKGAWEKMRQGEEYDALADAARSRAEADWLVGLNATRAMTCLARSVGGGQLLSVGRVQTPTLAMIVARDAAIAAFVPEDFWQVQATMALPDGGGQFQATWFQKGGLDGSATSDEDDRAPSHESDDDQERDGPSRDTRLRTAEEAEAVAQAAHGKPGTVVAATRKRTRDKPPLLYDLTSLQRRANQRHGLSAAKTLELAQALYERHKLITYPRTDARHLTPDQVPVLPGIVRAVGGIPVYAPFANAVLEAGPISPGKRVVDAAEVGDHHAILPTERTPSPGALSPDEKRIYDLVARRLLAVLSTDALFDVARIEVAVDPGGPLPAGVTGPLRFRARGRMCVDPGWQAVDPPGKRSDTDLPLVDEGSELTAAEAEVKPGRTRPPQPHTDASLLRSMETAGRELDDAALRRAMRQAGLGTPATRAAILTTLEKRGFIVREAKHLRATERGQSLIAAVPIDELKSAELTGRWEARLSGIAEGAEGRDGFMQDVRTPTDIVAAILAAPPPAAEDILDEREVLGTCPVCGTSVREGRGAYSCEKGRDCTFVIFKKVAKRDVAKRSAKQLLTDGRTPLLKGFKSKAGKTFDAHLILDPTGKVTFDFPPREETPYVSADKAPDPAGLPCPRCQNGKVIRGKSGWGCDRWRAGCGWRRG